MLENIRGHSRGSIPPLRMPSLLPHDLCHEWNVSRRLPALLQCMKVKKVKVKVAQSCPTLRDPMDCSPPGSSIHGILQARVLEWVASYYSKSYHSESCLWTGKPGVLQSLGSQRVRHDWATELTPGDHPDPAIEPISLAFTGRFFSTVPPGNLSPLKKKNSETS